MVRYTTAGESHGKSLITIVEGIPAGVDFSTQDIRKELEKRRGGIGRGERQSFEEDKVELLSGVIHGKTIASPIAIEIQNTEWPRWVEIMSVDKLDTEEAEEFDQTNADVFKEENLERLVRPRPGHADLEGIRKYGFDNSRPVLERASARETAARVAAGSVAKAYIKQAAKIVVEAQVVQFGQVFKKNKESNQSFDRRAQAYSNKIAKKQDTVGGVVKIVVKNVPPGLGSYISAETRLDARLAGALMSIQAVKGVEIGSGFDLTQRIGSHSNDQININKTRMTNYAGGIEGGISNGEEIIIRIAIKPIPSVPKGLKTVDLETRRSTKANSQRSDTSAVYPARIVAEAQVALILADALTQVYGQDVIKRLNK